MRAAAGIRKHAFVLRTLLVAAVFAVASRPAAAQQDDPLTPAPPYQVHKISPEGRTETAPIPPDKIIQSFVSRSDEYLRAHTMYGFKRSVRVQEITPDGQKGREVRQDSEVYLADNGKRYERSRNEASERFLDLKSASVDVQQSAQVPLFPLTSSQLQYYDLTYKGSQPLDELNTYIFEVKPKRLLPRYKLFSGIVYVDDQDLAIVKLYGTWKSLTDDDTDPSSGRKDPFSLYEMYYENVGGKYWFPTYIRSDAYVHTKAGDEQLKLTVRMTDFKVAPPVSAPGGISSAPGSANPAAPPASPAKPEANGPAKPLA
jgi:hypothetical protein